MSVCVATYIATNQFLLVMVPVLNALDLMPQYKLGISRMYSENH